jgi:hypothetical protein
LTPTRGCRPDGTARAGVIVAAALCFAAAAIAQLGGRPAAADPMPFPASSSAPVFYATPLPSPQDDIPTIYHAPLPIPSPQPSGATPEASPGPTSTTLPLAQGQAVVKADQMYGSGGRQGDITALGHVDIKYGDIDIIADQAVYDGLSKIITATGHVKFINANGDTATAVSLEYDTNDGRVTMNDVVGQSSSLYAQGEPIQGYVYYKAQQVTSYPDGHTILKNGWITTCDLSHVAYHITGKEIEVRPGDRIIARHSDLYLGKYLVAALGILVIPLSKASVQHPSALAPRIGYNSTFGWFVKTYINFYRNPYYYGTYHVDYYQKVGIGLGADLYLYRRDQRGQATISFYNLRSNQQQIQLTGQKNTFQGSVNLTEPLGAHVTSTLNAAYSGQSSVFSAIPPQTSANLAIAHNGARTETNYGLNLSNSGNSSSLGLTLSHTIQFSQDLSQNVSLSMENTHVSGSTFSHSVGLNTDTHFTGRALDGDLTVETSHGYEYSDVGAIRTDLLSFQKLPELTLNAHSFEIDQRVPIDITLVGGVYDDPYETLGTTTAHVETSRLEGNVQLGDALVRVGGNSDLTAMATLRQDAYGTGDLRGLFSDDFSLHTLYGTHADTTLSYSVNSVRGFTPLQSFDGEFASNTYTEALDVYNGSFYRFTASTSYDVLQHFQSTISYQLTANPGPYSSLTLGTSYDPHGTGYSPLSIQLETPVSKTDYLQMLANYDFKLHGLQGQNYYLTHNVNDCYLVRVAYLQPLHEVDLSVELLAFPGQGVSFGFTNQGSLLPQSFGQ